MKDIYITKKGNALESNSNCYITITNNVQSLFFSTGRHRKILVISTFGNDRIKAVYSENYGEIHNTLIVVTAVVSGFFENEHSLKKYLKNEIKHFENCKVENNVKDYSKKIYIRIVSNFEPIIEKVDKIIGFYTYKEKYEKHRIKIERELIFDLNIFKLPGVSNVTSRIDYFKDDYNDNNYKVVVDGVLLNKTGKVSLKTDKIYRLKQNSIKKYRKSPKKELAYILNFIKQVNLYENR